MNKLTRKHDYKEETIADVRKLISVTRELYKENSENSPNMPVLAMPQEKDVICYYNGMDIVHIEDGKWSIGESFKNYIDENINLRDYLLDPAADYKNLCDYLKKVQKHKPNEKERRCQQVISVNNIKLLPKTFSVCGFETSLPGIEGEIDMVIFNPDKHEICLVEYKCTTAALTGDSDVIKHTNDYVRIIKTKKSELVDGMVDAYNVLRKINGMKETKVDRKKIEVKILFLFTADNFENTDCINTKRVFKEVKNLYIGGEKPNQVRADDEDKMNIFWEYAESYKDYKFCSDNFMG